jgi:D-amino-acid dehydrogenase
VRGGIYFPGDAHLTPHQLFPKLIRYLKEKGVDITPGAEVEDIVIENNKVLRILTNSNEFTFDEVVVATGSWSGMFCKKFGLTLPMQAGKGYSFTQENVGGNVSVPSILIEDRVAVTPMGTSLRIGGTMEIAGIDHSINMNRVDGILSAMPKYYPELKIKSPRPEEVWHGLRPCSPDGLPYIGRDAKIKNLVIATGHSMMGLSLGPATGKVVSQLINEENPPIAIGAFDPARFN